MKKIYTLAFLLIVFSGNLSAQIVIFEKTYNFSYYDIAHSMVATADGGLLLVGETRPETDHTNMLLLKLNADGDSIWSRIYGGDSTCFGHSIKPTADGNYLIAGNYGGQAYLLKVNSSGDSLWSKTFYYENGSSCKDVIEMANGNTMLIQQIILLPAATNIICIDSEGNEVWTHYTTTNFENLSVIDDNTFIAAGHNGMVQGMHSSLSKFDISGNELFGHTYEQFQGISTVSAHLNDSIFFLAGLNINENYFTLANIMRANSDGEYIVEHTYLGVYNSKILDIKIVNDQYLLSCGNVNGEAFILATNINGDSINSVFLNNFDLQTPNSLEIIDDYLYVAGTNTINGIGKNIHFAKLDINALLTSIRRTSTLSTQEIQLYPNPAKDMISFQIPFVEAYSNITYSIFEMNGRQIKTGTISNSNGFGTIDLFKLPDGIYVIVFQSNDIDIGYQKFVVKH